MFEPVSQNLSQLSAFAVIGFFLAAFYEIIRIIRLFKRQSDFAVGITDFIFLSVAGVVTFAYSMELGGGRFRWFFVFGEVFGAAVYFLTIGRMISLASNFIVKCIKRLLALLQNYIIVPIKKKIWQLLHFLMVKVVKVYNFIRFSVKDSLNLLKSKVKVLYNRKTARKLKITDEKRLERNARNVVKGKIRRTGG